MSRCSSMRTASFLTPAVKRSQGLMTGLAAIYTCNAVANDRRVRSLPLLLRDEEIT